MVPVWQDMFGLTACDMCQNTKTSTRPVLPVQHSPLSRVCLWKANAPDTALFPNNKDFNTDSKGTANWTMELYNQLLSFLPILSANKTVLEKDCAHFLVVLHCYHLGGGADVVLKMSSRVTVVYLERIPCLTLL